jgi:HTH-type transcriptional regulator/antitoxin HigA
MTEKLHTKRSYHEAMVRVYTLMDRGEQSLSIAETDELTRLAAEVERYEDEVLGLDGDKKADTLGGIVLRALFDRRMTQAQLAEKAAMPPSKVSGILNGKRKPDVAFLKAVHNILGIDAERLLRCA